MSNEVLMEKVHVDGAKKVVIKIKEPEDIESEVSIFPGHFALAEIYGVEKKNGKVFVVEEKVHGISLDGILRGKGLPIGWREEFTMEEIAAIGVQLCDGVRFLHGLNPPLLHGDIKPENIILQKRNPISVKLIDCDDGFAWHPNLRYRKMKGTVGFCAPEQTSGACCDFSIDIYGIGKTLEFLLYGCRDGSVFQKRKLWKVIGKATSERPKERYVTAYELRKELK